MSLTFALPKSRLLRWLVVSSGVEDDEKQSWLIANMFNRTASLVGAGVSELIVATTAVILHRGPVFIGWLGFDVLILAWRIGILSRAKRAIAQARAVSCAPLASSSLIWAGLLGFGTLICYLSGDPVLQLLSAACTLPIAAGISARNANTPRLALTQMTIIVLPGCLGAALAPQLWLKVLLVQVPFFLIGLTATCMQGSRDLVSMLDAQHRNAQLARRDLLSGLPNRVRVNEDLQKLLGARQPVRFALIWVDLDGFKAVNDTLGHAAGDAVIAETARRLQTACAMQPGLVARLGGDEFVVIARDAGREEAQALSQRLAAAMREPHALHNAPDVRLDASIGISLHPEHGGSADALLAAADKALYAVKASGKARVQVYDPLLHAGEDDLILFRSELARALSDDENQLQLHYQPVMSVPDGRLLSREALVRWNHPVRGQVSPAAFVPMAEASGLIIPLGKWVIRQACADAAGWDDQAKVAVNVSPFQLRTEGLIPTLVDALRQTGLPADRLEVEVTETVLLSRDETTTRTMQQLHAMGIEVVLDDFGTGFSSLSNLCSFVFDRIKIDGSFVREALTRRDCAAVVHATVELARQLGIPTTAECIETEEQLAFVTACGCSAVQGYLLGRPAAMPARPVARSGDGRLPVVVGQPAAGAALHPTLTDPCLS